jgi:hypothetical protein
MGERCSISTSFQANLALKDPQNARPDDWSSVLLKKEFIYSTGAYEICREINQNHA